MRTHGLALFSTPDRAFNRFLWGQLFSQVGENASKVALPWLVLTVAPVHHTAGYMSLFVALLALPPLLLGWFYGALLDRLSHQRKTLLLLTDVSRGLVFLLIPFFYGLGILTPLVLATLVFLSSVFSGLFGPAMFAAVPEFSERAGTLVRRNTAINMTGHVGLVVGPLLGGILSGLFPPAFVLLITGTAFLVSAAYLYATLDRCDRAPIMLFDYFWRLAATTGEILLDRTVLKLAWENTWFAPRLGRAPLLFTLLSFLSGLSLGPIVTGLPLYAKSILHGGPVVLGLVLTVAGLGMLAASGILGKSPHHFGTDKTSAETLTHPETWLTIALFCSGILVVPTAMITGVFPGLVVTFFAAGLADIFNPIMQTEIQSRVKPEQTGRVLTSLGTFFLVGFVGGTFLTPTLQNGFGLFGVFAFGGAIRLISALIPLSFVIHAVYIARGEPHDL